MIALVYVLAYAFYNLDSLNILYAIVPVNRSVVQKDLLVRFLYAAAALPKMRKILDVDTGWNLYGFPTLRERQDMFDYFRLARQSTAIPLDSGLHFRL